VNAADDSDGPPRADHGFSGPLLVVADNASIARFALEWERSFAAAGCEYRVRLAPAAADAAGVEDLMAEARSLAAAAILSVGPGAAAAEAARRLGLPCHRLESLRFTGEGSALLRRFAKPE